MRGAFRRGRRPKGLARRIFFAFGLAIVTTFLVAGAVFAIFGPDRHDRDRLTGMVRLVGDRFAYDFDDPRAVRSLAEAIHRETDVNVEVRDARGGLRARAGSGRCSHPVSVPIARDGVRLGDARLCFAPERHRPWVFLIAMLAVGGALWALAFRAARYIARPLEQLEEAVRDVGRGKLDRRVGHVVRARDHEVVSLARAIDEMAERIERLIRTQRDLLATVSHEIRSPLARLRVLTELAAESPDARVHAPQMAQEIAAMDALVGDLLASVRLDAGALVRSRVDLYDAISRTLVTLGVEAEVSVTPDARVVEADATLLTRAISILIDNARVHGALPLDVSVSRSRGRIVIAFEDDGPGVPEDVRERIFEAFVRGEGTSEKPGVGLGLSLVRRIAIAHGGTVEVGAATTRAGARFVLTLP